MSTVWSMAATNEEKSIDIRFSSEPTLMSFPKKSSFKYSENTFIRTWIFPSWVLTEMIFSGWMLWLWQGSNFTKKLNLPFWDRRYGNSEDSQNFLLTLTTRQCYHIFNPQTKCKKRKQKCWKLFYSCHVVGYASDQDGLPLFPPSIQAGKVRGAYLFIQFFL